MTATTSPAIFDLHVERPQQVDRTVRYAFPALDRRALREADCTDGCNEEPSC